MQKYQNSKENEADQERITVELNVLVMIWVFLHKFNQIDLFQAIRLSRKTFKYDPHMPVW